jgi:hypothetical protein
MLTFILIVGLVWLFVALVFIVALAAAARAQLPVGAPEPMESAQRADEFVPDPYSADGGDMLPIDSPVPT